MSDEPEKVSADKAGSPQPKPTPAPVSMPTPMPTPFPSAAGGLSKEVIREMRTKGQRYLFINVMLMFLVSIVVFTIASYFFLVPRVVTHDIEIRGMESKLDSMREELGQIRAALTDSTDTADDTATDTAADDAATTGDEEAAAEDKAPKPAPVK
jgi:hypothetical protein